MPTDELVDYVESIYYHPRIDHIEDVENYVPGGYHPVDIGDTLGANGKDYEVIHKLGSGGFSTVWLVRSLRADEAYFALKVLRADADTKELTVLQHLKTVSGPGHPNIATLHDHFKVVGPNGEHHCLILPFLGPSLHLHGVAKALSGPVRESVCRQISSALAFLHEHGICHGDLTASNVVFELPDTKETTPATIEQLLGPIVSESVHLRPKGRSPHAPKRIVQNLQLDRIDVGSLSHVKIVDFGEAFFKDECPSFSGSPIDFVPPEICFGYPLSEGSDIWQLACVFFLVHTGGGHLFPTFFRIFEILVGTVGTWLGPLPESWKNKFNFEEFGLRDLDTGELKDTMEPDYWYEKKPAKESLEERLVKPAAHLTAAERAELLDLLFGMLAYEPQERLSALEVNQRLTMTGQAIGPLTPPHERE